MSTFWVSVQAPMDVTHVGPFASEQQAKAWIASEAAASPHFDFCLMTEAERAENVAEFGECAVNTP
jgi:hypothetical protein